MNILDAIFTRRSIRKFTGEIIKDEELEIILKAGFQAPTAHNRQPWEFVVVQDKDLIQKITDLHKYAKMFPSAGTGIIVCGDMEKEDREGFLVENCSASIQNMLLAAHGIGLGAVWCGLYPVEEYVNSIKEILGLPENIIPVGLVVVGNKSADPEPSNRYDEDKIHYDKW